ncbi:MAG: galactose-1-phosphate uridylyltransferase [Gemmatimonadetes bacterium]|nr:galactose-1-phosphate uridylyltransferase [Gemmatimonadota bacterium]
MSKTLVTGGAGYVGSHTVEYLLELGRPVVVLDDLSTGHQEVVDLFTRLYGPELFAFERVDLRNLAATRDAFQKHRPSGIIDFAARSLVGESQEKPQDYFDTNVLGFWNLVRASEGLPLVKSTTAATYGDPTPEDLPLAETYQDCVIDQGRFEQSQLMPAAVSFESLLTWYDEMVSGEAALALTDRDRARLMIPTNVYGLTKLIDELILEKRWQAEQIPYTALRYFNVAGASESGLIGEDHDPETHLIPICYKAVLGQRSEVTIFGTDYGTEDGTAIRDYVSVYDLARAHVLCLDRMRDASGGYVYNLGTREGYSVREILDTAASVTGDAIPQLEGDRRAGDPERLIADASLIASELGWKATTPLKETMFRAWRWHSHNPHGFRPIQEERYNPFWQRWITFASQRGSRPWEGDREAGGDGPSVTSYEPTCYLCPGNTRTTGIVNPDYVHTYVFENDFPSLSGPDVPVSAVGAGYAARTSAGVCEVIVYSRDHSARMSTMPIDGIAHVVDAWVEAYDRLSALPEIEYVLIFENRGAVMGNSQLHPHGQVYAFGSIPDLMLREQIQMFEKSDFVAEALETELIDGRRVLHANDGFCAFVPFAAWMPYDICIAPRRAIGSLSEATDSERTDLAELLQAVLKGLDSLFDAPYQYSLALIQAPSDGQDRPFHAQIHITSLLRGPDIRKHVVGADIFGRSVNPSDPNITAAEIRRAMSQSTGMSEAGADVG